MMQYFQIKDNSTRTMLYNVKYNALKIHVEKPVSCVCSNDQIHDHKY